MTEQVVLWESVPHYLPKKDIDELEEYCFNIWKNRRLSPTYSSTEEENTEDEKQSILKIVRDSTGNAQVTSQKYIGMISAGSRQYIIFPKIYKDYTADEVSKLLEFQFKYAYNLKMPDSKETKNSLSNLANIFTEVQILSFARKAQSLLRRRNYLDYQEVNKNIQTVRGRIDFNKHIKSNIVKGRLDRMFCQYEVYQEDNLLLRIGKYVGTILRTRTSNIESRNLLAEISDLLDTVETKYCCYNDTLKIKLNYYQQDFQVLLDYCKMFLSFQMAEGFSGEYNLDYVLINTADLFEKYVVGFLNKELTGWKVSAKKRGYIATHEQKPIFAFENDFLLQKGNITIIGDTKYKIVDFLNADENFEISSSDVYQMISYAVRRKANTVILVYPGDSLTKDDIEFIINDELSEQNIRIFAFKINMKTDDVDEILSRFEKILSGISLVH